MKHNMKSIFCLCLVFSMLMSFSACASKSEAVKADEPMATETAEASDRLVYTAEFQPVKTKVENGLTPLTYTEDGFYAQSWEKVGEREIPKDAVILYEGQYDIYGASLYYVDMDGNAEKLVNYAGVPVPEDTEDRMDYYGSSSLSKVFVNEDGTLTTLESLYINWYDGPESERYSDNQWNYIKYEQMFFVRTLDKDGKELNSVELDYDVGDSYMELYNAQMDADGNLYCTCEQMLLCFSKDGSLLYSIESDDYLDGLLTLKDGRLAVVLWGNFGMELRPVDFENKSFDKAIKLPKKPVKTIIH